MPLVHLACFTALQSEVRLAAALLKLCISSLVPLTRLGPPCRSAPQPAATFPTRKKELLRSWRGEGKSILEIGKLLGRDRGTASRHLKKLSAARVLGSAGVGWGVGGLGLGGVLGAPWAR